jgi:hypothetical protein
VGKVTDKQGKPLKAYSVQDGEHGCIVFASNSATARRNGASELGCDWEDIESCRRAAWADTYAQDRRVPPLVMIEHGWWFECCHCECHIDSDREAYDDDGEPRALDPVEDGNLVFCTPACRDADHQERAARKARKEAATRATIEKFPGVDVQWADDSEPARVSFKFPGGKGVVNWTIGDDSVWVTNQDVEAWKAFKASLLAQGASA